MAEYGAYKNSEGYADPTAYEAIRGMAKPGEIWTYKEREVLIIKNQGSFCNILQLGSYKKGCVEVAGRYAQPGMLSYAFSDLLSECVEKLTDADFASICEDVAEALDLQFTPGCENASNEENTAKREVKIMLHSNADPEREALKAQNDLLQKMYNDLLGKVIAKIGA